MNSFLKTFVLLGILSVIVITLGGLLGGSEGIYTAFFFSLLMNGGMYFFSDKLALSMSRAKPLGKSHREIYEIVEELSRKIKIPMPKLYITLDQQANPALSSLYIGDPFGGLGGKILHLFSTHPSVEERIKRLRQIKTYGNKPR